MGRAEFKSECHAALSEYAPPDVDKLLSTGAMSGPHRKTRPHTVTWRTHLTRALRNIARNFRSPL